MATEQHRAYESMAAEPPGIVSVNSRGGKASGIAAKLAFVLLGIILLSIAALLAYNRHRAIQNQADQEVTRKSKSENKPASVGARRTFDTDPPVDAIKQAVARPTTTTAVGTTLTDAIVCPDGTPGQVMTAAEGQPMLSPAGLPIRMCTRTAPIVPAVEPIPSDRLLPMETASHGARDSGAGQPAPSRYGGDVMVPGAAAVLAQSTTSFDPAMQSAAHNVGPSIDAARAATPGGEGTRRISLRTDKSAPASARMGGDRDMLLPHGRSIDCNLSVRLISEVAGKATCVLSSHAYSDNGKVVLAERGSTATGDYVALLAQGQRRLFVVWTQLRTPKGVVIDIDSAAADALGTTGLPGHVDNRWAERIGAAFLLSLVDDAVAYETAKASRDRSAGSGGNAQGIAVFQNSAETGSTLAERILESTINIKPTLYKHQGERATIFVSRDLDFGRVYALRAQ